MPYREGDNRQRDQRKQGQFPTDREHERDSECGGYDRIHRIHDSGAEQHPDITEIVCCPRHELAGLVLVVEGQGQCFKPGKELTSQRIFDVARYTDEEPPGGKSKDPFRKGKANQNTGKIEECASSHGLAEAVDRLPHYFGTHHEKGISQNDRNEAEKKADSMAAKVG